MLAAFSTRARAEAPVPAPSDSARIAALERTVDALTQEIESLRLGAVAETTAYASRPGLVPGASRIYGRPPGVSLGGYGEVLFSRPCPTRQGGARSGLAPPADVLRAVLYVGYKFRDELLLNTEIELEHAGVFDAAEVQTDPATGTGAAELTGEVTLEFAYLEWGRYRGFGIRAGKLLVPVGLTNEIHEPPTFPTARRPEVETFIIPTTWTATGAGIFGELPHGASYRAYVVEGLDAARFEAGSGIREGRQETAQPLLTHPALTGRLDWSGGPGLELGLSGYAGDAWQGPQPPGWHLSPQLLLGDLHARLDSRGLRSRALYARGHLAHSSQLSEVLGLGRTGPDWLGAAFWGGFVEAGYDVLPLLHAESRWALAPYARLERYDTQSGLVAARENPAFRHRLVTAGLVLEPHPDVAIKGERVWRKNDASTGVSEWNLALGYLF